MIYEVEEILKSLFDQYNNGSGTSGGLVSSLHSQSQGPSSQSESHLQDQLGDEVSQGTVLENGACI